MSDGRAVTSGGGSVAVCLLLGHGAVDGRVEGRLDRLERLGGIVSLLRGCRKGDGLVLRVVNFLIPCGRGFAQERARRERPERS